MDHGLSRTLDMPAACAAAAPPRPALALVTSRLRLALPAEPAPPAWREALEGLLAWTGIAAELVPPAPARRLSRMAEWARAGGAGVPDQPVFAPWIAWSPAAFQHGGLPALPEAQFAAAYLLDHARGAKAGQGATDLVLMSPHPALCAPDAPGEPPLPRAGVVAAMIAAARAERRRRLALVVHARQRNALATRLLAAGKGPAHPRPDLEILTIEDALAPLMSGRAPWDAIIAMPDLRSTVFTLLAEACGVRRAWPMLWRGGAGGGSLLRVTSEAHGEGASRLALDATALIHALALALDDAGAVRAAARLHEGWARLRDSGVTTAGEGADAPYSRTVGDADFIALMQRGAAASRRPQPGWRALGKSGDNSGSQTPDLRVVSSNLAISGR